MVGIAHDITDRVVAEAARQESEAQLRQSETQLRQQTQDLEHTVIQLQKAQTQLVQSEKMSSLGQMVAGIAHEINNPVGFIHGNLKHARDYIEDVLKLLELYRQQVPDATPDIQTLDRGDGFGVYPRGFAQITVFDGSGNNSYPRNCAIATQLFSLGRS